MTKLTLTAIALVLLAACDKMDISPVQADSFIKFYKTFPVFTGADVKEIPGQGFAVLGTVRTYTAGTQICLIRTDQYGNWIDSARYFGGPLDDEAFCLQVLGDHSLAILGSSTKLDQGTEKKEAYFIKTDGAGNVLWTWSSKGTGNVVASHFEVSTSGSFIMTGYADTVKFGVLNRDIWLFGLDEGGNPLPTWRRPRYIGGTKDDVGTHLQILDNGDFVITGETRSDQLDPLYSHAFILQTNSIGLGPFSITIPSTADEIANCIRVLGENSYLVLGTTNNNALGSGNDIMLKKVSISGGELKTDWATSFVRTGNDAGECMMLADTAIHLLVTTSSAGINSSISVITTDLNGNILKEVNFGESVQLTGSAFEKTSDNGFIITGTNKLADNDMSLTLIKLKSDGTL